MNIDEHWPSNAELLEFAAKHPAPDSWLDEDGDPWELIPDPVPPPLPKEKP